MSFSILITLIGCQSEFINGDVIQLEWTEGQEFHIASSQYHTANMTETGTVSLENFQPSLNESSWSDEVIWTYRVIETDYYPTPSDELFDYAISATGDIVALSVIQVTLDPTLNYDPVMLDQDPVSYLIFRSERNRLAGLVQFQTIDGERREKAYSSRQLNTSWSVLSQSNMGLVPTYLAPHGMRWSGGSRALENNSTAASKRIDMFTTDVIYDDVVGGELVSTRYQTGYPWPTMTMTNNMTARLLSEEEINGLRGAPLMMDPEAPEQLDYVAALSASIDLDRATQLHENIIETGELNAMVEEEYRPWAGAWWPLTKGELVFGYDSRPTFSDLIFDEVKPLKKEMDELSSDIRDLRKETEVDEDTISEKKDEYKAKQKELVDILVEFYSSLRDDLDSGKITVADGKISKEAEDLQTGDDEDQENQEVEGWEYEINDLSPMDKFALVEYLSRNPYQNPFYLSAWEILNSYNPGGESWWGHCNGWAAAAILTHEPREPQSVTAKGQEIEFTTADLKGLLTESHYSTQSQFYGERYNGEDDDISDLTPAHFQSLVSFYLHDQGVPFVFDTTAAEAVWNFPVWEASIKADKTDTTDSEKLNVNLATADELSELDGISQELARALVEYREDNGNFQNMEELGQVDGYNSKDHSPLLRIEPIEISYDIEAKMRFTDDGVNVKHVGSDGSYPTNFFKTWHYTIKTDAKGTIIDSSWDDEKNHPDFAWVPYHNPRSIESNSSENPYLAYEQIRNQFGSEIERK